MHAVLVTKEELARLNLPKERPAPHIVISVEGGLAQGYSTNGHGINVTVLYYDEDDHRVSQADGGETTARHYELCGTFEPFWVNADLVLADLELEDA